MLLIDEVAEEVFNKVRAQGLKQDIQIVIYMDYEYWSMCMAEIRGAGTAVAYEFYTSNTVMGYPVYKVIRHNNQTHVPFRVVQI